MVIAADAKESQRHATEAHGEPLMAHGADATTPNEAGATALDWALQCEDAEAAQAVGGVSVERRIATEIPDPQVTLIQQELASKLELHRQVLQVKRGNARQDGDVFLCVVLAR